VETEIAKKKITVLKPQATKNEVLEYAEKKKTGFFGSVFSRPKPEEVEVLSAELFYEPYWLIGGSYHGDYFRKNSYEVKTDRNVKEVIIGKGTFQVKKDSGTWSRIRDSIKGGDNENKLIIPVEEHVLLDIEEEVFLNSVGTPVKFKHKLDSDNIENFPDDILNDNQSKIRPNSVTDEQAVKLLTERLQEELDKDVRIIKEKISIDNFQEIFTPVYEVRCTDSNNKVEVIRIDAMDLKII